MIEMGKIHTPKWDERKDKGNNYDALDMIIHVLMEQEKHLDEVVERLEKIAEKLNEQRKRQSEKDRLTRRVDKWKHRLDFDIGGSR